MSFRKILFWCHLTVGCAAGIVILTMSISGVLLAFERQCLAWANGRYHITPRQAGAADVSVELIQKSVPQSTTAPPSVTIDANPTRPVQLTFGRERTVLIDPANGKVLGDESGRIRAFFTTVERIHRTLGGELRSSPGRRVTGACNLAFLFLVVSGVYLWVPKKWSLRNFRTGLWFKKGLRARARDLNWHKTVGFWSALPLFFIVLTGTIMSLRLATNMLYRITGTELPAPQAELRNPSAGEHARSRAKEEREVQNGNSVGERKSLDELLSIAKQRAPGWKRITFRIPEARDRLVTFSIDKGNGGQPEKRLQLTLTRMSGEVKREEGFATTILAGNCV